MRKGISLTVSVILLLMVAVGVTSTLIYILPNYIGELTNTDQFDDTYIRSRSCLSLEQVDPASGSLVLRNCGKTNLTEIELFVDGISIDLGAEIILEPMQSRQVSGLSITSGQHELIATADYAESAPYIVGP